MEQEKLKSKNIRTCVVCGEKFYRKISPGNIRKGKGKCCSIKCKSIYIGNLKKRGKVLNCIICNKPFYVKRSETNRGGGKYCSRKCYQPTPKGKAISLDGYYTLNGKKVHRIIMEKYINRKLLSKELVHHINGDKLDNKVKNLQIVSRSMHNKIHKFLCKEEVI